MMRCYHALVSAMMLVPAATASAGTLYNNTIPSGATSGFCTDCVLVDDVLVPSSRDPFDLPVAMTEITVGVLGAGSTGLSIYSFPVANDGTPAPSPTLINSTAVSLSGFVQPVAFGNGSTTLFTVEPNFTAQAGFGLVYIGLKADNADWVWANGPDANLPTAYLYHQNTGAIFLDTSPGPPFPPDVSYYLSIEGTPIPEPASIAFLGPAILLALGVRRRGMPTAASV